MHGSLFDKIRVYLPMLEWEFEQVYNEANGTEFMKKIVYPWLEEAMLDNDFNRFMSLMPFARRFAQRMGYTP